jgi:DNA modification methylase
MEQLKMFKDLSVVNSTNDSDAGEDIQIFRIDGDIPEDVVNNSYLNIFRNDKKSVHNIALYPCKFIPQLPRWAIEKYSKEGDTILDPFSGGGTTLIESRKLNRNVIGFDYNPYAVLIGKVKSAYYEQDVLEKNLQKLITNFINEEDEIPLPEFRGIKFWFNNDVLRALSVIKKHVNNMPEQNIKDFFKVVFSMVVRKASFIAPGQILTARRKDWKESKQYNEEEVYGLFRKFAVEYINYVVRFTDDCKNTKAETLVNIGDARDIKVNKKVDLIISSPPYINAMDYIWANRLRVHWLDLVKDDKDRLNLYKQEIGTESIKTKEYDKIGLTGYASIDKTIKEIYYSFDSNQQSKLRSRVVYKYFIDMEEHLKSAYESLKNGGRYCIVIGDNNIRKVRVCTTDFLVEIAENVGFTKELQCNILLKNRSLNVDRKLDFADLIKYDRMIVLQK